MYIKIPVRPMSAEGRVPPFVSCGISQRRRIVDASLTLREVKVTHYELVHISHTIPETKNFSYTKVWIKSYGSALVKPPIGIVMIFAKV
jgi:hypothetical protein